MARSTEDAEAFRFIRRLLRGAAAAGDPALLERLLRRGLIERAGDGRLAATREGEALVRRFLADPDNFAAQHQERGEAVVDDPGFGRMRVVVNNDESPLLRLRRQKGRDGRSAIDDAEFAAGERLRADFTRAQMTPRVTANWTASVAAARRDGGAGGIADLADAAIAARQRVERALSAVGPELAGVLVDFCCFLKGIKEVERERRWPARSAKLVVRFALAALARHHGLTARAEGAAAGPLRHWGAADYRPTSR